jgi:IMP dehydrogenase
MANEIGRGRLARRAYGLDEVALAPGPVTLDPELVDTSWECGDKSFKLPVLAAAMDAVVDPPFAGAMARLGGLAVLNLQGVQTRYERPAEAIEQILNSNAEKAVATIQRVYSEPVKDDLILKRIDDLREVADVAAVSSTPAEAERVAKLIGPGRVAVFVVQATVTTVRHVSNRYKPPSFKAVAAAVQAPVIAGNCVTYEASLELMQAGVDAILVGVGPGAQCTSRRVLGIGVPQVTAIADVAAARDDHEEATGKRVAVIADGGMRVGGDISKAIASGADAVMLGSSLAMAQEAPGRGYQWGMSTGDATLPRGTRIEVGTSGPLKEILLGPSSREDGTMNLMGALRLAMASCGAANVREMQKAELVIAPALLTEGKAHQRQQRVGHGRD